MRFFIQASAPAFHRIHDGEDESLSEAIETVFPMMTEDAFLSWNAVRIPLNYKYDVSCMIEDILEMLEALRASPHGALTIHWPSSTFNATWVLSWARGELEISARWLSVAGNLAKHLNGTGPVHTKVQSFLSEWHALLATVGSALNSAGYSGDVGGLERLKRAIDADGEPGYLYATGR